jgi:hypothetical protein
MATSCLAQQRGIFHTETNETTFMIHHARGVPPSRVQARGVETGGGSMMAVIDFIQGLIWLGVAVSPYATGLCRVRPTSGEPLVARVGQSRFWLDADRMGFCFGMGHRRDREGWTRAKCLNCISRLTKLERFSG